MSLSRSNISVRGPCTLLRRLVFVALLASACGVSLAWAQAGPPRVDDPPGTPGTGGLTLWENMQISLLPAGSSLGTLWASSPTDLYVWATPATGTAMTLGDFLPRSWLLHYDGASWSVVLDLTAELGASVYGTCKNDVFASASTIDGAVKMYHYNGAGWSFQTLPAGTVAPAGAIAGGPGNIYFRAGYDILRWDGVRWLHVVRSDGNLVKGLSYIASNEVYASCCTGHCHYDGVGWNHDNCGAFLDVGEAWGMRGYGLSATTTPSMNPSTLTMYAVGCSPVTEGFAVWQFVEGSPGSKHGTWVDVQLGMRTDGAQLAGAAPPRIPEDPPGGPGGGTPVVPGTGVAVWGSSAQDVYVAGTQSGTGLLYHFDGLSWTALAPIPSMPLVADIWGTGPGEVWVSFTNGRLLHYAGGASNPNPEAAGSGAPSVSPGAMSPIAGGGLPTVLAARVVGGGHGFVTLEYAVPKAGEVSIAAFDIAGRHLATIERTWRDPGTYRVNWSTTGLARGMYFYQVRAGDAALARRVAVLD